jgi:hypothetical protein
VQFNSGLIGCALAMVDLVTQKPVGAGSAVLEYTGFPFLPPSPTLALGARKVTRGLVVGAKDEAGATTYWWLSTLAALNNLLTGGNSTPKVTVAVGPKRRPTYASSSVVAAPASYSNGVFRPPRLSGAFRVPSNAFGGKRVTVTVTQKMLGITLMNSAFDRIKIIG